MLWIEENYASFRLWSFKLDIWSNLFSPLCSESSGIPYRLTVNPMKDETDTHPSWILALLFSPSVPLIQILQISASAFLIVNYYFTPVLFKWSDETKHAKCFCTEVFITIKNLVDGNALLLHKKDECGDGIIWCKAGRQAVKCQRARGQFDYWPYI